MDPAGAKAACFERRTIEDLPWDVILSILDLAALDAQGYVTVSKAIYKSLKSSTTRFDCLFLDVFFGGSVLDEYRRGGPPPSDRPIQICKLFAVTFNTFKHITHLELSSSSCPDTEFPFKNSHVQAAINGCGE